ncbi:hypothetical protein GCM10007895_13310 [Paraferrimonas sedimenticola]|uniref:Uncharacterized protein n=1 Tax=Paraferrimonas sedimenticola TaxID=375674 RepID=A0AA37W073_9GAMM|nr:hypothetical protein GCM10007895_13310 [Paraferrimonas sedimenticola]
MAKNYTDGILGFEPEKLSLGILTIQKAQDFPLKKCTNHLLLLIKRPEWRLITQNLENVQFLSQC